MMLIRTINGRKQINPDKAYALGFWCTPKQLSEKLKTKLFDRLRAAVTEQVNKENARLQIQYRAFDYQEIDFRVSDIWNNCAVPSIIMACREMEKARYSRRKASVLVESMSYISTCILTQGEINGN